MCMKMYLWWESVKANLRNQKGQGMVEYGLILTFVALAALVALTSMGTNLGNMFTTVAGKLTTGN
ncbi:flp/fap pilin component [Lucifera butyrica]|uniref:Flp/fap pilin component n=1 Tax=Lucifera butyrica TaxID=1351585 RepID=A0A498R2T6_9FIRM|nr:Flp family type IVb pilin [Lucifera butyrica]VBB05774.1 flp/fap pilin component [Lucifera butyrica]